MCLSSKAHIPGRATSTAKDGWDGAMTVLQAEHRAKQKGAFHNERRRQGPWEVVFDLDLEGP